MPIAVCFRGPMLFITDDATVPEANSLVNRIVIPDATEAGKHADGTKAVPHFAGLLLIEPGRPRVYLPLRGRTIELIADGKTGVPGVDENFRKVPPLRGMTNPPDVQAERVNQLGTLGGGPATVTMTGGSMSGGLIVPGALELGRYKTTALSADVCTMPIWRGDGAATGRIRVSGGDAEPEVIHLTDGVEAYIYNWDVPFPSQKELTKVVEVVAPAQDNDAKWVYSLLVPEGGSWKEWLSRGNEPFLPAARTRGFMAAHEQHKALNPTKKWLSAPTATCDGFWLRGS